jgi:hypothetical protein
MHWRRASKDQTYQDAQTLSRSKLETVADRGVRHLNGDPIRNFFRSHTEHAASMDYRYRCGCPFRT